MYLSLRLKVFIPLVLVALIGIGILTLVWFPHNHKLLSQDHHQILMVQLENISQSISSHLLSNDLGELYSTLETLSKSNPNWLALKAYDSQDHLIYPLDPQHIESGEYIHAMAYPIKYKNKTLGRLEVVADFTSRHEELNTQRWQLLIIVLGGALLISLVAGATLELAVRRPVSKLVDATKQITLGNYDLPLPKQARDEIGNLINCFEHMRLAILEQRQKTIDEFEAKTQAQELITQKSKQISVILDNTTDAYLALDTEQAITFINNKAESIFDIDGSLAFGNNIWDILPELSSFLYIPLKHAIRSGEPAETEVYYSPQGLWLETHISPNIEGSAIYLRDITTRKLAEQALSESEQYQRAILNNIADGILTTDRYGKILSFNLAAERIIGYSSQEIIGQSLNILMNQHLARQHDRFLQNYTDQSQSKTIGVSRNVYARHKNGHEFPVEITITEMTINGNQQFVGILRDITERLRSEEQLRLSDRIFSSNNEGILITDSDARILRVNAAFLRITGYQENEVIGHTPQLLSSGRHTKSFYARMWQQITDYGHWQGEIWNKRKDGEVYPEWLSISSVKDNKGSLTNYVAIFSDITEKKEAEEQIYHMAHHDALTGLLNRNMFNIELADALEFSASNNQVLAVLYLDLDHFKKINDTFGHPVGDELLKVVAQRLTTMLRSTDLVCRIGGDEFIILLQHITQIDHAGRIAKNIIDQLMLPIDLAERELFIGASIGIAAFPQDASDPDDLVRNADAALFRAKQMGRNNYQYYSNEMNSQAAERLDLETKLRHALDQQQFILYYQPQLDLNEKRIIGVEALVRWMHPELGLVSPADFIPLLEETGLIIPVGEWILLRACLQAQSWRNSGLGDIRVAVNISPHQFLYSDILQTVDDAIHITGLPPHLLELEITEGSIMTDAESNIRRLQQLSDMGIKLAIDDFGTGYSSLAYLKRFPIDALKIDQSFIRDMHQNSEDANIAAAITSLGKSLGLRVIAEGVEEQQVLKQLQALNCDEAQGYFISRPINEENLIPFLREQVQYCHKIMQNNIDTTIIQQSS